MPRSVRALAGAVLALLALGGCGGGTHPPSSVASPASSSAPAPPPCPSHARCFDFAQGTAGWPEDSDDHHYAERDPFHGGSYRVGSRESGTYHVDAPVDVSALAADYGVRLDLTATISDRVPDTAAWGATCWTAPLPDGRVSGFGVYVSAREVSLGLYDQVRGTFHPLRTVDPDGAVRVGKPNDLRLECRQDLATGRAVAEIQVQLNDAEPIVLRYPHRPGLLAWRPADGAGLLAAGEDADVFFDDVRLTGRCQTACG